MRVEIMRTFPVPRKKAFDYLDDFHTWPMWYSGILEIIDPEKAAWEKKGDKVRFAYKLLGRRVEGESTLEEVKEAEYVKMTSSVPTVGDIHQEWTYADAGDGAFSLKVIMETDEPTKFFGKLIDKMVIPKFLEKDLLTTFEHLEETFAVGVPE